jgi:hypothetical protein
LRPQDSKLIIHYMIPGMVLHIVSGHTAKKVIDWAKAELEGLRR